MSVVPESTRICLLALVYAVQNETGILILQYCAKYPVLHLSIQIAHPQAFRHLLKVLKYSLKICLLDQIGFA